MKGQTVCTRGIVTKLTQTRQVGSRYQFTDKPGRFFLFSKFWEIYDTQNWEDARCWNLPGGDRHNPSAIGYPLHQHR